jgi:hypothetical protein
MTIAKAIESVRRSLRRPKKAKSLPLHKAHARGADSALPSSIGGVPPAPGHRAKKRGSFGRDPNSIAEHYRLARERSGLVPMGKPRASKKAKVHAVDAEVFGSAHKAAKRRKASTPVRAAKPKTAAHKSTKRTVKKKSHKK